MALNPKSGWDEVLDLRNALIMVNGSEYASTTRVHVRPHVRHGLSGRQLQQDTCFLVTGSATGSWATIQ